MTSHAQNTFDNNLSYKQNKLYLSNFLNKINSQSLGKKSQQRQLFRYEESIKLYEYTLTVQAL